MKQLMFNSGKGGAGKSTLTTNYATYLAAKGHKVLLVDLDVQSNASFSFGVRNSSYNVLDIYKGYVKPEEAIIPIKENLDLISCNRSFSKLMFEQDIRDLLTFTKQLEYDFVLYDLPPSLENILYNVLKVVDGVVLVFVPEPYSVDGLLNLVEVVNEFNNQERKNVRVFGTVINLFDRRINLHKELVAQIEGFAGSQDFKLFPTYLPRSIDFVKPLIDGKPSLLVKRTEKTKALEQLFDEITEEVL